jgi:hypothetical protein
LYKNTASVPRLFETVCIGLTFMSMSGHGQEVYLVIRMSFVIGSVIAFTIRARLGLAGA